ncbi:MAG TPA: Maf family protein [Vicinamibacterales bacterium]|nr:Maf family protein [Vicinamibacterales bacterium]
MPDRLVLASASPRRAELLAAAGYDFTVDPAHVDESERAGETPENYVLRVAGDKARTVAARRRNPGEVVLGADTTVVANGEILAKPADESDAVRMLRTLAGVVHHVFTGVVVVSADRELAEVVATRVHVLPLSIEDIQWYVRTGEPMGKAGAYAIQGRASRFVDWIEGSWSNVVGLPVATVNEMIKRL